jgi:hypothetical protein
VITLPLVLGLAAIDRLRPVDLRIAAGDGAIVDVPDLPIPIGVHCVEHRHRETGHRSSEFGQISRLPHPVPLLDQATFLQFGHAHRQRLPVPYGDDRSVMGLAEGEGARNQTAPCLLIAHEERLLPTGRQAMACAVTVVERILRIVEGLFPEVDDVRRVDRVAPAE